MILSSVEQRLPTEDQDVADILRGILAIQKRFASEEHHSLRRGTHAKGICARARFEVYDLGAKLHDRAVASRLAQGLFATPGTYNATIRFANAESRVLSDTKPDVRALSFSVEVPPGVVAGDVTRIDFSLNSATTFPINDAHAFASLMKVLGAGGPLASARAFFGLSPRDMFSIIQIGVWGTRQKRASGGPYQKLRYWSTVPFEHGADVVKYAATPDPANPAAALNGGPFQLRDELARHLTQDSRMSAFDFSVQLLDPERMTFKGTRRSATFWVENGAVEWNEQEAPFHVVGRLTLVEQSQLTPEACERSYIDVTEHAAPASRPLGSLNRARLVAEAASRKARMGPQ